jgi:TonB-linked SusC/RagA family outer membrane protein
MKAETVKFSTAKRFIWQSTFRTVPFVICFLLLASLNALAQGKISGKVTDANGLPVSGASIVVKGSNTGTAADEKGNFSLEVGNNATLVVSAVGFTSQELKVSNRTVIPVVLVAADRRMDEVVVVGYGTQRKRDLTGSITSVKGEEIENMPNTNPIASLQGKVAGLTVATSGQAGVPPVVRIRGVNSTNSASPVYVVDGILLDNINFLNAADIETIDILRDPSSIAIYGMRGANGVIAITTKRAARGKTVINLQSTIGVQRIQDKIEMVDATGFRKLYDAQLKNINAAPFDYTNYTANTNWQDEIYRDALINTNSLSISNTGEKSTTLLNIGYTTQEGVLRNDKFERFLVRLNQEINVTKGFKVGGNINGYFTRSNPPVVSISNALRAAPIVPVREGDMFYTMPSFQRAEVANPAGTLFRSDETSVNENFRIVGSLFGEVKFLRDFTLRSTVYMDLGANTRRAYTPLANTVINLGEGAAPTTTFRDPTVQTEVAQEQSENRMFQQDHTLTYNKKLGRGHNITGLLGYTTIYSYGSFINGNRRDTSVNIPNDANYWYLNVSPNFMPGTYGGGGSESSSVGGFARVSYNYEGKYLLNATIRRDGTSKFAPENRWGTFGSVGVGWVASDEAFMKNIKAIDFLKFRGAWGTIGNSNGFADFLWKPGLNNASTAVFGNNAYTSVQAAYLVEPDLRYEVVNGLDLGFDLKALKNRLSFGFTYYDRTTKDILTNTIIPNDGRSLFTNLGNISNKGVELTLGWAQDVGKDFSFDVSTNFSYNVNKVESIGKNFDFTIFGNSGANRTITGESIGHFFGYTQTGVYQTTADLAKTPAFINSRPGDISYADINGDGVINQNDRSNIGTPFPPYSFGGAINLQYKAFDFMLEGQGVAGNKIYVQRRNVNFTVVNYESNRLNAWTAPGTTNIEPILDNTRGNNFQVSTYFLEPGDYFRIRTLQLGYNFTPKKQSAIGIKKARAFISGQNLKTWTQATGYTPEPQIGSILGGGADNGVYPVPAIYTFGVNLTF